MEYEGSVDAWEEIFFCHGDAKEDYEPFERKKLSNKTIRFLNLIVHLLKESPIPAENFDGENGYVKMWESIDEGDLNFEDLDPVLARFARPLYALVTSMDTIFPPMGADGTFDDSEQVGYPLRKILDHLDRFARPRSLEERVDESVGEPNEDKEFHEFFYHVWHDDHPSKHQRCIMSELFYMLKLFQKAIRQASTAEED